MAKSTAKPSPAKRVRARRRIHDPGVYMPPLPPPALLTATRDDIKLTAAGVHLGIKHALASAPYELTITGASSLTLNIIDADDVLLRGDLVDLTEDLILDEGVVAEVGGIVWRLNALEGDGGPTPAWTFIDDVAWRMQQDTSPMKMARGIGPGHLQRAQFIYRMADQARQPPRDDFDIYIPELNDVQGIAKPTSTNDGTPGGDPGFSDNADITVKGVTATRRQRQTLGAALAEAYHLKAADRVMVAVVMALIEESRAGEDDQKTGNDDVGPLQQGREWISAKNTKDVAKAVRAFLLGDQAHVGGTGHPLGWLQRFGSLRHAPGDLNAAITAVQGSSGGYSRWEDEAKRIVKAWNPSAASGGGEYAKPYEFTRGTSDGRESSWQATGRLTDEANSAGQDSWHYWAALNAFYYASDAELRQAAPSLTLRRGAAWLLGRPVYRWNRNRPVTEMTFSVLAHEWGLLPGSVVAVPSTFGPLAGPWLVRTVRGQIGSKRLEVVIHRPVRKPLEPAHDMTSRNSTSTSGPGTTAGLLAACRHISGQNHPYVYGGGHGVPLAQISPTAGLDCSSSVSLALKRADLFHGSSAITSGEFASSWGKPGKGKEFTVWASPQHVWIEGYTGVDRSFSWRFDTVPYGSGGQGPHVRRKARPDYARFTPRHWPGL